MRRASAFFFGLGEKNALFIFAPRHFLAYLFIPLVLFVKSVPAASLWRPETPPIATNGRGYWGVYPGVCILSASE
jgi:hypothetical protein